MNHMGFTAVALVVTLGILSSPLCSQAQQPTKIPYVGIVSIGNRLVQGSPTLDAFKLRLRELGWVEGKNVIFELRNAEGSYDRLAGMAKELVTLRMDIIVAPNTTDAAITKKATSTVPIVYMGADPVENNLARSREHPDENLTGVSVSPEVFAEHLRLLKEIVPGLTRVAALIDPSYLPAPSMFRQTESAARSFGLRLQPTEVLDLKDLEKAFEQIAHTGAEAVVVVISPKLARERKKIAELALQHRLPMTAPYKVYAEVGALLAYEPDTLDWSRRLAQYVDKILRGAKPGDLPIEQSAEAHLFVNLKTAKALGLTIPQSVLSRAEIVIPDSAPARN